ncbi:kti12, chromatin associated [Dispira simplex]|nr:kti12, chromatin associated [Dispira simplex]
MPLVVISGIPCAGKSQRAQQLVDDWTQRLTATQSGRQIHWLRDETLGISKTAYDASVAEKRARGQLLSAVERLLSRDDFVIADGLNYIKGLRYQLYCVARAISTPHCVMHVATPTDRATEWNAQHSDGYPLDMFDNLVSRYEEPNGMTRWDSPLFTVLYTDDAPPLDAIWDALVHRKAPPPLLATAVKPVTATNYLQELDKVTQDIINTLLEAQKDALVDQVTVPNVSVKLNMPTQSVNLASLRRLRRQYININRMHVLLGTDRIAEQFVEYLNTNLQ